MKLLHVNLNGYIVDDITVDATSAILFFENAEGQSIVIEMPRSTFNAIQEAE